MKKIDFKVIADKINIFHLKATIDHKEQDAILLIASVDTKGELLSMPEWISDQILDTAVVSYDVDDMMELWELMEEDDQGSSELREVLQSFGDDYHCYEISEQDFQANLILKERSHDGEFIRMWNHVFDPVDAFIDMSSVVDLS